MATQLVEARFAGSGSLSAVVEAIIPVEVSIIATSSLQANASNPLQNIVGNPKNRLVFAVEVGVLPIN